jgi:prephenate dehydrogenase
MTKRMSFRSVSLVGVGLIGGSWGLALKRRGFAGQITGCDHAPILDRARAIGAIDEPEPSVAAAVREADLVILAAPVGAILEQLRQVKDAAPAGVLVTDTGSTKEAVLERAREIFNEGALFIGGHPLAGKEQSGIESAHEDLFVGARYVLTPLAPQDPDDERWSGFCDLIEFVGARSFPCDAATHDRALAFLSHLPQLMATSLASIVADGDRSRSLPLDLAAAGFRDMTRLAESPYVIWRDVCLTNRENLSEALDALIRKLEEIKDELADERLEQEFRQALELRERWRKVRSRG